MEPSRTLTVSSLLLHPRPLTGALSLSLSPTQNPIPNPSSSPLKRHKPTPTTSQTLTPSPHPAVLVGSISLPSTASSLCRCLSFSDASGKLCCEFLDFDPGIVGRTIRVLAWNFIPFGSGNGVLEVIRWEFVGGGDVVCGPEVGLRGLVRSVSPVFAVQWRGPGDGEGCVGFLVELGVCGCGFCGGDRFKEDCFGKVEFAYFFGSAFVWHPVVTKLVGKVVQVSGLNKKRILVGKDESYLLLVSTEKTVVCKCWDRVEASSLYMNKDSLRGIGELGSYEGVVTGVFAQGMIVELDEKVWLLLGDPLLSLPHFVRVGALITVRNVHLICSDISSTRILLLGACVKATINIKKFSPIDSQCPVLVHTENLLGKLIASCTFSAQLWMQVLISSFKRKFATIFTEKEILGSKDKEGLAQAYANSCLSPCSVQNKAVFMKFCNHDDCDCAKDSEYSSLKFVVPLSNFVNNSKAPKMSPFRAACNCDPFPTSKCNTSSLLHHEGYFCSSFSRKFISSKEYGLVLLGYLHASSTGRLQMFDSTGSIDVVIPDLPSNLSLKNIYEIKDYTLIIEGSSAQIESWVLHSGSSLSIRSMFLHSRIMNNPAGLAIYAHFYWRNSTCLNFVFCLPLVTRNVKFLQRNAVFRLLFLTHKFPAFHPYPDPMVASDMSVAFAEGLYLPYNLNIVDEYTNGGGHLVTFSEESEFIVKSSVSKQYLRKPHGVNVLCEASLACSSNYHASNGEETSRIPCLITSGKTSFEGFLVASVNSSHARQPASKVVLEFKVDSLQKHQLLRIGTFYILKQELGSGNEQEGHNMKYFKANITSQRSIWSISFSVVKPEDHNKLPHDRRLGVFPMEAEGVTPILHQNEIFFHQYPSKSQEFDVQLHLPSDDMKMNLEMTKFQRECLINFPASALQVLTISSFVEAMKEMPSRSTWTTRNFQKLPQGVLVSLCGTVRDIQEFNLDSCVKSQQTGASNDVSQEAVNTICIHLCDGDHMVKIQGSFGEFCPPIGLGSGANATFHRLLLARSSSELFKLTITPASFIVVNSLKEVHLQTNNFHASEERLLHMVSLGSFQSNGFPENNLFQFHCRVDQIFILVLEKQMDSCKKQLFSIPLIGVLVDDGSSICCCWADDNNAKVLLRLQESILQSSIGRTSEQGRPIRVSNTVVHRLGKILKKHHRVIVNNYGSVKDPKCVDLSISVASCKIITESEEKFLKSIILHACRGPQFHVSANLMTSIDLECLKRFTDLDVSQQLATRNICAREVKPLDFLSKARSLLDELLDRW